MEYNCSNCGGKAFKERFDTFFYYEFDDEGNLSLDKSQLSSLTEIVCVECGHRLDNQKMIKVINDTSKQFLSEED